MDKTLHRYFIWGQDTSKQYSPQNLSWIMSWCYSDPTQKEQMFQDHGSIGAETEMAWIRFDSHASMTILQEYCSITICIFTVQSSIWLVFCFIRMLPARLCDHRGPDPVPNCGNSSTSFRSMQPTPIQWTLLYRGWVQHNSNRCAEGLGGEVASELCSYYTRVSWMQVRPDRRFNLLA
jgi:hypothetical protein